MQSFVRKHYLIALGKIMIEQSGACHKALCLNPRDREAFDAISQIPMKLRRHGLPSNFYSRCSKLAGRQRLINHLADEAASETSSDKRGVFVSVIQSLKVSRRQRSKSATGHNQQAVFRAKALFYS